MINNYVKLSEIYEFVMRKVRYDRWSEYLYYLTREYLPENPSILELGAGKCSFTSLFSEYYPKIIATDLSLEMLKSSKYKDEKICCNMLNLPFKNKFDFIYSTFDSVNYITTKHKLLKLFTEVSKVLTEDGIFTFDCSMEKNSLIHAEEPVRTGKYNGFSYIHKSEYSHMKQIHTNTFVISDAEGRKFKEVHKQKIYDFDTYFDLIPRSGLYVVQCFKAFSFVKGTRNSERLQFILKKEGNNAVL